MQALIGPEATIPTDEILDNAPHLLPGISETPTQLTADAVEANRLDVDADREDAEEEERHELRGRNTKRLILFTGAAALVAALGIRYQQLMHFDSAHDSGKNTPTHVSGA